MPDIQQIRKGTTPLFILSILDDGPLHGYAIMRKLTERSDGYFKMTAALLYPTLHQMEKDELIEAVWKEEPGQRRRKIYSITPLGRKHLVEGHNEWKRFFNQLFGVMDYPKGIQREQ